MESDLRSYITTSGVATGTWVIAGSEKPAPDPEALYKDSELSDATGAMRQLQSRIDSIQIPNLEAING